MQFLFNIISFNRRYVSASLVYLGLTCMLLCTIPEIVLYARNDGGQDEDCSHVVTKYIEGVPVTVTVPGCPDGFACCGSTGECAAID